LFRPLRPLQITNNKQQITSMKLIKRLIFARRKISITTKFGFSFIALLLLICIVALTGFFSLRQIQDET
jgi:hypothetical protein